MNILVVNWLDRENPAAGGAETHLHETFGRLVGAGHAVTLLCSGWRDAPARTELDGIRVLRTGRRHTINFAAPRHFARHLADDLFDVVVEDLNKVPLFTPLWAAAPVVLLVHHLFGSTAFREASFPVAAATWLLERTVPYAFRGTPVIAISESTARDLVARGLPSSRIRVVPNGVDVGHYTPGERVAESGAGRFAEPSLLYLGRLKRYKGVDLVLRAVARLRERDIFCRLRIVGKGDHRASLEALTDRLGLRDRVDFLGFVSEARKLELLRRSWIHVLASPKEGWGIANLEAAACGTPTVASDSPGLRDSVCDGETGFLVPHGDIERMTERLATLIADPALRERMGRLARLFAEKYSWDETAREFEAVLRQRTGRP